MHLHLIPWKILGSSRSRPSTLVQLDLANSSTIKTAPNNFSASFCGVAGVQARMLSKLHVVVFLIE